MYFKKSSFNVLDQEIQCLWFDVKWPTHQVKVIYNALIIIDTVDDTLLFDVNFKSKFFFPNFSKYHHNGVRQACLR